MGGRAVTKVFEEACARLESDHPVSCLLYTSLEDIQIHR